MYKFVRNSIFSSSPIFVKNQPVFRAIDCVQDDLIINKFGHIRSDFAVLTETTNGVEFARALANMQASYSENSSQFDGMTFEQMVATVRPRWCQLPGEVDRFEQYLIDNALEFYKDLREKLAQENDDLNLGNELDLQPATLAPAATTQPSE